MTTTSTLGERFERALVYACRVHGGQTRKGTGIPYVSHVLAVAATALEDGGNEDEAIAALLHDAVEDGGGQERLDDICVRFGTGVAGIVRGCSDAVAMPKPPWLGRKQAYLSQLRSADDSVLRVALADKLHNARAILRDFHTIGDRIFDRFTGGKSGTLWYYACLAAILTERARNTPLAATAGELHAVVTALWRAAAPGAAWPAAEHDVPAELPAGAMRSKGEVSTMT